MHVEIPESIMKADIWSVRFSPCRDSGCCRICNSCIIFLHFFFKCHLMKAGKGFFFYCDTFVMGKYKPKTIAFTVSQCTSVMIWWPKDIAKQNLHFFHGKQCILLNVCYPNKLEHRSLEKYVFVWASFCYVYKCLKLWKSMMRLTLLLLSPHSC